MNIQLRSMMIALFAVGIATAQRVAVLEIDVANAVGNALQPWSSK